MFRLLVRLLFKPARPSPRRTYAPRPRRAPRQYQHVTRRATPPIACAGDEICGRCWVIDGDTIVINKQRIRLFGIDAPELNHPYGNNAKFALVKLCKGQPIRAIVQEHDVHDRVVAKCYLRDGTDLSAELVRLGLALDWATFSGGAYRHLEPEGARKKLWRADSKQRGRMFQ